MRTSTMVNEIGEASAKESVRLSSDDFLNFLTHSETVAVMKRLIYDKLSEKT